MARWDAIVAGAGPAGAVAALVLARAGRRVLLCDRPPAVAHKVGETLPGAALRILRAVGAPVPAEGGPHARIAGARTAWGDNAVVTVDAIRDPYGPGWRLDRLRFDADLRAAAVAAGATRRIARIKTIARTDGGWRVCLDDASEAQARFVTDASGRGARIARKLGIATIRDSRLIALYRIAGAADGVAAPTRTLIESTRDGWWYAAGLPTGATVAGFHTDASTAAALKADPARWQRALAATRLVAPALAGTRFSRVLPPLDAGATRLAEVCGDGWIACGDAALAFDPLSGQGLFSALHGGLRAAEAASAALDGEGTLLAAYRQELDGVWRIYAARRRALYAAENRWPDAPFWTAARTLRAAA